MWYLILKDFRANWLFQLISLLMITGLCLLTIGGMLDDGGQILIVIYLAIVISACSLTSLVFIKSDEYHGTESVFVSLPVARKQIVVARYITSLIQILLVLTCCYLATKFGSVLQERYNDPVLKVLYLPVVWAALLVFSLLLKSFSYPAYFKYGLERGMAILAAIHFGILTLGVLIHWMFGKSSIQIAYIQYFLEWLSQQNGLIIIGSVSTLALLCWVTSLKLSCKFYKTRDL
ncbi:MAG: ABC-2 transporter permease [Cyclobacteriaceae bacterium]|nr:ABC-2 transporter permease [Cyclobacteriaceae bacterium HetDA_MAG_MS6]